MGIETKRREIGSITFEVTQLQYFRAQRLLVRLVKLAGPALVSLAQLAGTGQPKAAMGALLGMQVEQLAPALGTLFAELSPEVAEDLTREILRGARGMADGTLVTLVDDGDAARWKLNAIIGGNFWAGLALQAWALQVHFGNFSGARVAFQAAGLKASPSEASTTSTGGPAAP